MTVSILNTKPNTTTASLKIVISEDSALVQSKESLLTFLHFGETTLETREYLAIQTSLGTLSPDKLSQYWLTEHNVQQEQYKNVRLSKSKNMVFGHVLFSPIQENNFKVLCEQAYIEMFECLKQTGCIHLLRTWNFFPNITKVSSENQKANNYDLFCQSRLRAMQSCKIDNKIYPAATVIGNHKDCLQIYFLASDTPGVAVENPRQISAYNYPVNIEQAQPLFSRGLLKTWGKQTHFYVSGTASIVGYKTLHINNVNAQLNEAINNIETLVTHANDQHGTKLNAQDDLLYMKIYIKRSKDVEQINQVLAARLSSSTPRILLLGDMCRDELLVEIEAFYQS